MYKFYKQLQSIIIESINRILQFSIFKNVMTTFLLPFIQFRWLSYPNSVPTPLVIQQVQSVQLINKKRHLVSIGYNSLCCDWRTQFSPVKFPAVQSLSVGLCETCKQTAGKELFSLSQSVIDEHGSVTVLDGVLFTVIHGRLASKMNDAMAVHVHRVGSVRPWQLIKLLWSNSCN